MPGFYFAIILYRFIYDSIKFYVSTTLLYYNVSRAAAIIFVVVKIYSSLQSGAVIFQRIITA